MLNMIIILPIEENEIMVLFDATYLYTNNPIIDTLTKIKDYVNNDGQFTRKTAIPQDKFLDLVNLFLTTNWYTFSSNFTNELIPLQWEDQHLQLQHKFICRLMNKLQYLLHYTLQNFRNSLLITFIPFLNVPTWKTFSITSTIFIKTLSLVWRKNVMEN